MKAEIIADPGRLQAIEPAWWALFDRVPDAIPFVSPAWLLAWWHVFAPGRLHTAAVWEGDRLVALAPCYVEDGGSAKRLLPLGIGISDVLDVLVDPVCAEPAGEALAQALSVGDWDFWSAEEADEGAAVLRLPDPRGWRSSRSPQSACPVLALPSSSDLRVAIPAAKLRKWRMAQNRVERRSWLVAEATRASLPEALDTLFSLHRARWQERGEPGVLDDPDVQAFHRLAAPALLDRGLLRCSVLEIDGEAAGVFYGLQRGATAFAYLGGFDPRFGFESPGTLLIGKAIQHAAAEGATAFNFLRGQEGYKYDWGAVDRWTWRRTFERAP